MYKLKYLGRYTVKGDSPVDVSAYKVINEYGGTRDILSEDGGTILQG